METTKQIAEFFLNGYVSILGITICISAILTFGFAIVMMIKFGKKLLQEENI
jgi:hypothetical protein